MSEPIIILHHISKTYTMGGQQFTALRDIDLTIRAGEFVALMGPSGSGKSTLMNILGCLDRPHTGSYLLGGREVSRLTDDELAHTRNRDIGFVFQNFNLLPRLSALENVALPLVYAGVPRRERTYRAERMLADVGLTSWRKHTPTELSGGQRQRVAIARALVHNPPLIMADEPTGNLDTRSTQDIINLLKDLQAQKKTVILVTHEPEIAAAAERQLLLRDGTITRDEGKGVVMDVV